MAPDHPRAGVVVEPFSAAGFHDALACCQQRLRRGIAEASPARPGFTSSICRWMNGRQICVSCGVGVRLPGGRHGMTLAMLDAGLSSSPARSRVLIIRSSACPNVQRTAVPRCPPAARSLADEHDARLRVAVGEHQACGGRFQRAAVEQFSSSARRAIERRRGPRRLAPTGSATLRRRGGCLAARGRDRGSHCLRSAGVVSRELERCRDRTSRLTGTSRPSAQSTPASR